MRSKTYAIVIAIAVLTLLIFTGCAANNKEALQTIESQKKQGKDLFNRDKYKFKFVNDISFLPQYVLENKEKYSEYIWQ